MKKVSLSVAVWNLIWTKFMESNINSVINKDEKKFTFVKIVDIQQTMLGWYHFTFDLKWPLHLKWPPIWPLTENLTENNHFILGIITNTLVSSTLNMTFVIQWYFLTKFKVESFKWPHKGHKPRNKGHLGSKSPPNDPGCSNSKDC